MPGALNYMLGALYQLSPRTDKPAAGGFKLGQRLKSCSPGKCLFLQDTHDLIVCGAIQVGLEVA